MKVSLVITDAEVREAIRAWAESHGVPNAIVEKLTISGCPMRGGFDEMKEVRVKVEYESDSLAAHDGRPVEVEPAVTKLDRYTRQKIQQDQYEAGAPIPTTQWAACLWPFAASATAGE